MYKSTFSWPRVGSKWSSSRPGRFAPEEGVPRTHWRGGWVDSKAGLDDMGKRKSLTLPGLKLRPLGRPVCSQLLWRLRYRVETNIRNLHFPFNCLYHLTTISVRNLLHQLLSHIVLVTRFCRPFIEQVPFLHVPKIQNRAIPLNHRGWQFSVCGMSNICLPIFRVTGKIFYASVPGKCFNQV
jgi:hypothetical protein